jgi:hypothetical protein
MSPGAANASSRRDALRRARPGCGAASPYIPKFHTFSLSRILIETNDLR